LFSLENGLVPAPCLPEVRARRYISERTLHKENHMETFLETNDSWTLTLQRWVLGGVLFAHGAQKLLGWFGGYGWSGTLGFLTGKIGLPAPVAGLVILIEAFGPLFLLAGLATRPVALGVIAIMLGAIATVHAPNGFFMNWSGAQAGEGFEYHLLVIAMALALIVGGGGSLSADARLTRRARG
jgi:putative oxidoreductase